VPREIQASCRNCIYGFHNPNDPEELQRCRVLGMENKPPVNKLALMFVEEGGGGICEYYKPIEELKNHIVYKLEREWQIS